ncbi:cytochrome C peroxidase [Nostoc sp. 'Peltigera membranacea cyanobiont' 210A]|uniref:cytochrome-c peroxidase n=1 Tax=Nostoc sp. 'Peltigera membranacea cyanobiont' 210A TaxID=2014529 RepID=UPI000B952A26|nr:cytochrome c peroxidase [Nostoc sp. 'Peltigera membranacea cyanobiont' 210A]OYD95699.1 cytochrome C peroxidase [Nostoc sp. 'Peltigera membranacea cyanobiont' 210A]
MGIIPIISLVIFTTALSSYLLLTSRGRFLLKSLVTKIKRQEWRFRYGKPNYLRSRFTRTITIAVIILAAVIAGNTVSAEVTGSPPVSLKSVSVPEPDNLGDFVKDKTAAIKLGKTLFWDMQVGSDGKTSCASCHFHAGADNRSKNQIAPGLLRVNADGTENPDSVFNVGGLPNYQLKPEDFPFHKLSNPNDPTTIVSDRNDVTSSQGIFNTKFVDVTPGNAEDKVTTEPDPVFNVGGINVRRVEPRNTPTVINAAFNFRNFWDGRAQNIFNGVNPFGLRDPNAAVVKAVNPNSLEFVKVSLKNSSLASQAVGPPLSSFESSADGRTFQEIGDKFGRIDKRSLSVGKGKKLPRKLAKKLLPLRPLGKQLVHPQDSVLGKDSRSPKPGLKDRTYTQMIQDAFKPEWWKSNRLIQVDSEGRRTFVKKPDRSLQTNEYTLLEYNFSLFFGLAVQLYESTLISYDTPYDRYLEGDANALTDQQKLGKELFNSKGCAGCHAGLELTTASVSSVAKDGRIKRAPFGPRSPEDNGFFNIGVRPPTDDPGLGGHDGLQGNGQGNPLSEARLAQLGKFKDLLGENPPTLSPPLNSSETVFANGAFKAPGLRNVELTAPYFHNGGQATLEQVIDFYNRGGDFGVLPPLNLSPEEKQELVAFLKGLTDDRVRFDKAPFDHPQLFIPNGHVGNTNYVVNDGTGKATDDTVEIPAVGRSGNGGTPNFLS